MIRRLALVLAVAAVAPACTEAIEPVTEALSPSPGEPVGSTGPRLTEVVGDAIVVDAPLPEGDVGSPVSVRGTAAVVGGDVTIRVVDLQGEELAQAVVEASCDGCEGAFAAEVYFYVPERTPGWVEVSGASANGPAPRVRVPVTLFP